MSGEHLGYRLMDVDSYQTASSQSRPSVEEKKTRVIRVVVMINAITYTSPMGDINVPYPKMDAPTED